MKKSIVNIRNATPNDSAQIAFVHVDSWKTTYQGIVSEEYLNLINLQAKENYWYKILTEKCENVFVAVIDNLIVGFVIAGKGRDHYKFDSELYAIYILHQHQKKKIGTLLLSETAKYLLSCGHTSMYVWVLSDNSSKKFYERLGGQQINQKEIEIGEQKLSEVAYGWTDLSNLLQKL